MEGREAISELYEYRVRIQNENANLQAEDFLSQEVSLILHTETFHQTRYLHGIVADWQFLGSVDATERYWLYEFVIRPPIWYASLGKDCRIFQDESVVDSSGRLTKRSRVGILDKAVIAQADDVLMNVDLKVCK